MISRDSRRSRSVRPLVKSGMGHLRVIYRTQFADGPVEVAQQHVGGVGAIPPDRDPGGAGERPAHGGLVSVARGAAHGEQVGELAALVVVAGQAHRPGVGELAGGGGVVTPLPGGLPRGLACNLDEEPDAGAAERELHARQEVAHRRLAGSFGFRRYSGTFEAAGSKDRKSTRLNSSHANISYAVFCLKKKKQTARTALPTRRKIWHCDFSRDSST